MFILWARSQVTLFGFIVFQAIPMMINIIGEHNRSFWLIHFEWKLSSFVYWICFHFRISYEFKMQNAMFVSFTWSVDHPLLPRRVSNVIRPIKMFFAWDFNVTAIRACLTTNVNILSIRVPFEDTYGPTTEPNTMGHFQMLYMLHKTISSPFPYRMCNV